MSENTGTTQEVVVKKKRGRKPSKERKGYFYEEQEQAVVDYISTDNIHEKNRIFNTILKPAFTKMIESIIRRYRLYPPDEEFEQTFDDTMSFLVAKLPCFDPTTNYKAYSYCGTICKNYLIYKINQFSKNQKRNVSYDNPEAEFSNNLYDDIRYSYTDTMMEKPFIVELTGNTVEGIKKILENKNEKLTENDEKVGNALL